MASTPDTDPEGDLGFTYQARKNGDIAIRRDGRQVSVIRGKAALRLASQLEGLDEAGRQQRLARVTGNYKRGNERRG